MEAGTREHDSIVRRAQAFAEHAHSSIAHKRKYTGEPYITHLQAVADLVASVPHTEDMIAAAFLHDVVEDVPSIQLSDIERAFGKTISTLVYWLTDVSIGHAGNRETRKTLDRNHLAQAPADAQTIKLADIVDNAASIRKGDAKFWPVYRSECTRLVSVLSKGDQTLRELAVRILAGDP